LKAFRRSLSFSIFALPLLRTLVFRGSLGFSIFTLPLPRTLVLFKRGNLAREDIAGLVVVLIFLGWVIY